MSTLKVDSITNNGSAVDLTNGAFQIGGNDVVQGYTESASEPSSPTKGDIWWDTANEVLYQYLNGEFKELGIVVPLIPFTGDRAVFANGFSFNNGNADYAAMEYMSISTGSSTSSFGNLTIGKRGMGAAGASNGSRCVWSPGMNESSVANNVYDYIAIATTGNASDFGDSIASDVYGLGGTTNGTYGLYGLSNSAVEYITIATSGNALTFGDLTQTRNAYCAAGNNSKTLFLGGEVSGTRQNTVDYFDPNSAGNATDFGDLVFAVHSSSAVATHEKVYTLGGQAPSTSNFVQELTIATAGNATDYGDLNVAITSSNAATDMTTAVLHGGTLNNLAQSNVQTFTLATGANSNNASGMVADFAAQGGGASGAPA